MSANPYPLPNRNHNLTILAWITIALASVVPDIIAIELFKANPAVLTYYKMGALLVLALAAAFWKPLRPLRNFFLVMFAFFALTELCKQVNFTFLPLQKLFGYTVFDHRMQAEQTGKLAVSLAMIALLFILGYKRRDFFLARGDLKTLITPVSVLGFPKADPWPVFGLQYGFYIAIFIGVMLFLGTRPDGALLSRLPIVLPSVLFYAALNAFNEEITFRSPILATLEPVAGSLHALWMAAGFFGIAHYFGTPGGIFGALASIFMGYILSKAMVETRGLFWAWWIHFLSDVVIFSFLAMALLK